MHDPANSMDEIIRRATEEGRFDDLPGSGKPLKLDENPHERPDWRLANHLLKENDFTLPWIADRQEIEAWLAQERQALERAWKWFVQHPDEQVSWDTARRNFRQQVELINKRIWNYNLGVPSSGFQRMKVNSNREIERVMAGGQAEK
jgi:DnaJ family protein C protein 28